MKKYCFDTSGISNPLEFMPEDIHERMWAELNGFLESGLVAVTQEIYDEMVRLPGAVGACIKAAKDELILEVGQSSWDWQKYVSHSTRMQDAHRNFISEYTGGSSKTICLNDLSAIALAKTLGVPLVNMESLVTDPNAKKRKIPNICRSEGVTSMTFNEFLRAEQKKF